MTLKEAVAFCKEYVSMSREMSYEIRAIELVTKAAEKQLANE